MNLPNYFIADLDASGTLTATLISDACQALKRNREAYLVQRSTERLIQTLHNVGEQWRQPDYPFRRMALEQGPSALGFSRATLEQGLDNFFKQITGENIEALITHDLGHVRRLDELVSTQAEQRKNRAALARGPEMIAHIAAGNIPNPTLLSIMLGILIRSAQFVKCASGTSLLPRLFAHSIYDAEPKLGACLEIAEWKGGNEALEDALFEEVDCATATGSDETLAAIRKRVGPKVRLLSYGHRVSFGFITQESLVSYRIAETAAKAASDIVAWNQLGCLSPHLFYVEEAGKASAELFAEALSSQLEKLEELQPRGPVPTELSALITSRRHFYEIRAAHSQETRQWCSSNSTAWTVIYEADARFQLSCLNRFVYVKAVKNIGELLEAADSVRGQVSTVGLAAPEDRAAEIAMVLARWGVSRICPLGQMQNPPLTWRHDGRPTLGDLITWTDWEQ